MPVPISKANRMITNAIDLVLIGKTVNVRFHVAAWVTNAAPVNVRRVLHIFSRSVSRGLNVDCHKCRLPPHHHHLDSLCMLPQPGWRHGNTGRGMKRGCTALTGRGHLVEFHEPEQEAERRLLEKQWPGTSVMRGCTPLRLQWVWGTSQWWLSFLSPPFRGHFCPLQWAFCPLPAFSAKV